MAKDQLGHLEHTHAILAVKDLFELFVGLDKPPILGILQVVAANIIPEFSRHFGAGDRFTPYNLSELFIWCDGFHESSARFALPFDLGRFRHKFLLSKGTKPPQ